MSTYKQAELRYKDGKKETKTIKIYDGETPKIVIIWEEAYFLYDELATITENIGVLIYNETEPFIIVNSWI